MIPPALTVKADDIVYNEEERSEKKESAFDIDDRNFMTVTVDEDTCDNPYSTMNIQGILRNHRYAVNPNGHVFVNAIENEEHTTLPPLKLPNMNVVVDMMVDRVINSISDEVRVSVYERDHPSLFAWDFVLGDSTEEEIMVSLDSHPSNGAAFSEKDYLNMQAIDVWAEGAAMTNRLKSTRGVLCQFITFYMSYVRLYNDEDEGEAEEYGISTFVYYARRPFDLGLFDEFVAAHWPKTVIRAKGMCYFSDEYDMCYLFEQAGRQFKLQKAGEWFATMPADELEALKAQDAQLRHDWDDQYGDRMQKLVFIGQHLDKEAITKALDNCLA